MIGWFDISKERVKCQLTWYTWCDLMRVPCERTFQWNYLFAIKNVRYVISPVDWYLPVEIPFKNHSILLIAPDQFNPKNPTRANILWKNFPKIKVKISRARHGPISGKRIPNSSKFQFPGHELARFLENSSIFGWVFQKSVYVTPQNHLSTKFSILDEFSINRSSSFPENLSTRVKSTCFKLVRS